LIAQLKAACLAVSIGNQTIALCIDARLPRDVTRLALQKRYYVKSFVTEFRLLVKAVGSLVKVTSR